MKRTAILLGFSLLWIDSAGAAPPNCASIQNDAERLKCYDRRALKGTPAARPQAKSPALETQEQRRRREDEQKLLECRNSHHDLIGLSRDRLRQKCGLWSDSNITTTAGGTFEQLIYGYLFEGGPYLYVYLMNGVVTSVQGK